MTVVQAMASDAYRASAGVSHSELKLLRMRTPWHLYMQRLRPERIERPSPQMILGSATHCAVLEPDEFEKRYCLAIDASKNSNAWKQFALECSANDTTPLDVDQMEAVRGMRESLRSHPEVKRALSKQGHSEVSAWWRDPKTQVLCKCRPDYVADVSSRHGAGVLLLDLKTTADASRASFAKSIANFGYHTQADWYTRGYSIASDADVMSMLFVVVESSYPFACAAYVLDPDALVEAAALNRDALARYAQCMADDKWPGYSEDVERIDIPRWAYTASLETYL